MNSSLAKIEKEIISNPKLINKFTIIIDNLINSLQSKNKRQSEKFLKHVTSILSYYLKSPSIQPAQSLINFLNSKIDLLIKISIDLLKQDEDITRESVIVLFDILISLFKFKNNDELMSLYGSLTHSLFFSPQEGIDSNIIQEFNKAFKDHQLNILKALNANEDPNAISSQYSVYNIYNYLIIQSHISEVDNRTLYQNIMIKLINSSHFPDDLLKSFLLSLNKGVLENVANPLIFSDFIILKTSSLVTVIDNQHDIQILGLTALFVLITKYKLDYEDYYKLLYRLIRTGSIFSSNYYIRLYKVLSLSLKSPQVPLNVICSFIKLLSRLSLFAKDVHIIANLTIIMMIIQCHPKSLRLLTYKKTKKEEKENRNGNSAFDWNKFNESMIDNKESIKNKNKKRKKSNNHNNDEDIDTNNEELEEGDMFNEKEKDPYKTNAQYCSLWELYTLEKHFNIKIRKIVNKFKSNFLPKQIEYDFLIKNKEQNNNLFFDIEKNNAHFYFSP